MPRRCLKSVTAPAPGAGADADAPPPSLHLGWSLHGSAMKVAVAGNVIIVFLFFAVVVWRLFFAGRGREGGAAIASHGADGAAASSSGASTPCASPRKGGLGEEDLLALPVFVHGASPEKGAGGEEKVECAVCIGELRDGDTGRLLPRCGHRFHADCVDRWFRSHVTCPLCRAVVADGGSGHVDSKVASVV